MSDEYQLDYEPEWDAKITFLNQRAQDLFIGPAATAFRKTIADHMTDYKAYLEGSLVRTNRNGKPKRKRHAMMAFEVSKLTIGTEELPESGHTKVEITSTCEPIDGSVLGVKPWHTEYDHWEDASTKTDTQQVFEVTLVDSIRPDSSIDLTDMNEAKAKNVSEAWQTLDRAFKAASGE